MRKHSARDDGASAVEFALVLPLLVLLVFGIIEFGVAFAQVLSLNAAARQGARAAVTGSATCDDVAAASRSAARTIGIGDTEAAALTISLRKAPTTSAATSGTACTATAKPCAGERGNPFRVTVSRQFGVLIPVPFVSPTVTLTGKGEYRCESND